MSTLSFGLLAACGGSAFTSSATGGSVNSDAGGTATGSDTSVGGASTGGNSAAGGDSSNTGGNSDTGGNTGVGGTTTVGGALGTGGDVGTAGGTSYDGLSCADLQTAYSSELTSAETCTIGGGNTCVQTVLNALTCGCSVYANSARTVALTNLERIRTAWTDKKCVGGACPAIACVALTSATCVVTSSTAKAGVCTASSN